MYLRCPDCLMASWIDVIQDGAMVEEITCEACCRVHTLDPEETLEPSLRQHYRRTLEYSNAKSIDMPGAYAVLLGIMSLSRALRIQGSADRDARGAPARSPDSSETVAPKTTLLSEMEPEYQRAVSLGKLSVKEVAQRGDHEAFVQSLLDRHGMSRELAERVAANRISLRDALALMPVAEAPRPRRKAASGWQKGFVLGAAVALVVVTAWSSLSTNFEPLRSRRVSRPPVRESPQAHDTPTQRPTEPGDSRSPGLAATEMRKNESGSLVELVGPDPRTVLLAYCNAAPRKGQREPVEVLGPSHRDTRLGIFRDHGASESFHAIHIRRDRKSRRWVAGDGLSPIPVVPAESVTSPGSAEAVAR